MHFGGKLLITAVSVVSTDLLFGIIFEEKSLPTLFSVTTTDVWYYVIAFGETGVIYS